MLLLSMPPPPAAAGTAVFQITSPLVLLSATKVAVSPPGVHTSTPPSINGDSA